MKDAKVCAVIIMLCVIAPIIVGYVMPSEEVQRTGYETGYVNDISDALANDTSPVTSQYTGYLNNTYQLDDSGRIVYRPVDYTTSPNQYPYMSLITTGAAVEWGGTGNIDLANPLGDGTTFKNGYYMTYSGTNGDRFTVNGEEYDGILYATETKETWGYIESTGELVNLSQSSSNGEAIMPSVTYPSGFFVAAGYMHTGISSTPRYVDITQGNYIESGDVWLNGYANSVVEFTIKPEAGTTSITMDFGSDSYTLTKDSSGVWQVSDGTETKALGSSSTYEYLYIRYDTAQSTMTVGGLAGYSSFTQAYLPNVVNYVQFEAADMEMFRTVGFSGTTTSSNGLMSYWCQSAYIQTGTTDAISNVVITPDDWYPNGQWILEIYDSVVDGSSITITTQSGSQRFVVENGQIETNEVWGLPETIAVDQFYIMSVPDSETGELRTILCGVDLDERVTAVTLGGKWVASVTMTEVDSFTYEEYLWNLGSFGIGTDDYCLVGVGTALMSFIAVALAGRRSGTKMTLALITSAACGLVYLIMM